ncbi:MAG: FecR domain-containing protein [Spirochaetales bacterium]|nr:FecR domain-containing protein [Spirochaetales bacterium]MCF7939606.1 FecR domain-containing protein [Spirochaetales bacterium]
MRQKHRISFAHFLIIILVLLAAAAPAFAANATVGEVNGKVEVKNPGGSWQAARPGMSLASGSMISTGFGGSAVLRIENSELNVKQLTRLSLDELIKRSDKLSSTLELRVGKVDANVRSAEGLRHDFTLKSSVSTAAVRGTSFSYDGYSLSVSDGTVVYSDNKGRGRSYSGGQSGRMTTPGAPPTSPESEKLSDSVVNPFVGSGEDDEELPFDIIVDPAGSGTGTVRVEWSVVDELLQ